VAAVFAGLLTKVGVYSLIRVQGMVFYPLAEELGPMIKYLSLFTMVTGVLGAASSRSVRRILSFHIVSQIGYMTLALSLYSDAALGAGIFYVFHHIFVKTNLFLVSGAIRAREGEEGLERLGGLYVASPGLAVLFLIPAFSLGGVPPLSGFVAKFLVIDAALRQQELLATIVAVLVGLLTMFSMVKIWGEAFWKGRPAGVDVQPKAIGYFRILAMLLLCSITIVIGFAAEPLIGFSLAAAQSLLEPSGYVAAVFPGGRLP
jgi:multicomponent Na+:H+ antiporter subunit D